MTYQLDPTLKRKAMAAARNHHEPVDGARVRAQLIEAGLLVPFDQRTHVLTPHAPDGTPVLRLDDRGRYIAAQRIARGGTSGYCSNPWVETLPINRPPQKETNV